MNYATEHNIYKRINIIAWNKLSVSDDWLIYQNKSILCKVYHESLTDTVLAMFFRVRPLDKLEVFEVFALTKQEVDKWYEVLNIKKPMYTLDEE